MRKPLPGAHRACADYMQSFINKLALRSHRFDYDGTWPCIQQMAKFDRKDSVTSGAERQKRRSMPIRPPPNASFLEL